jgi:hypothetical protein
MACTACLVCFISTVNGHRNKKNKRKEEAYPWKAGASSQHTANLKQSILRLSISMYPTLYICLFKLFKMSACGLIWVNRGRRYWLFPSLFIKLFLNFQDLDYYKRSNKNCNSSFLVG